MRVTDRVTDSSDAALQLAGSLLLQKASHAAGVQLLRSHRRLG